MTKTFTENDLLRFIYGELTPQEKKEIDLSLLTDGSLRAQLREMEEMLEQLDKVQVKPPQKVVNNILDFSRSLESKELSK